MLFWLLFFLKLHDLIRRKPSKKWILCSIWKEQIILDCRGEENIS